MIYSASTAPNRVRLALTILRVSVASIMFIHGAARVALGIVDDFGGAFAHWGFPLGDALAWGVTIGELLGAPALAAGLFVRPLTLWFGLQLLAGIALIHAAVGWFVVGAGRNGMELSVLLLAMLAVIAMADDVAYRFRRGRAWS